MIVSGALWGCNQSTETAASAEAQVKPVEVAEQAVNAIQETDENAAVALLLSEWTGPFEGVPAFDKVELKGLIPALEEAMAMQLTEIDAIANNEAAATFENTIEAMERSGAYLDRVFSYYGILSSNIFEYLLKINRLKF